VHVAKSLIKMRGMQFGRARRSKNRDAANRAGNPFELTLRRHALSYRLVNALPAFTRLCDWLKLTNDKELP
jgi:hypothetical protein